MDKPQSMLHVITRELGRAVSLMLLKKRELDIGGHYNVYQS
jgi:hypothetical protein